MKKLLAAVASVLCGLMSPASAQDVYPSRPISIVVAFGPGSGTDVGARLLGQKLSEALGRPVVIENKPGANGSIAAAYVAKAKPDGYTLFMGTNSTHGANPALMRQMGYDPIKDFAPITRVAVFTSIIVVNPNLPVKNMQDLVAYGKANEMSLATGNASGVVMSETLARQVGWKLLRVPFKSNPQAMTEVVAGRVQVMFTDIAAANTQIKAGTLRPIVVTSKQRSALMPELPTIAETAVADYDLSGWIGLFAPAGTPRPIVDRLNAEVTKALTSADLRSKLLDLGAEPGPMPAAEFGAWVQQEVDKWTRLVKEAGIQPE